MVACLKGRCAALFIQDVSFFRSTLAFGLHGLDRTRLFLRCEGRGGGLRSCALDSPLHSVRERVLYRFFWGSPSQQNRSACRQKRSHRVQPSSRFFCFLSKAPILAQTSGYSSPHTPKNPTSELVHFFVDASALQGARASGIYSLRFTPFEEGGRNLDRTKIFGSGGGW